MPVTRAAAGECVEGAAQLSVLIEDRDRHDGAGTHIRTASGSISMRSFRTFPLGPPSISYGTMRSSLMRTERTFVVRTWGDFSALPATARTTVPAHCLTPSAVTTPRTRRTLSARGPLGWGIWGRIAERAPHCSRAQRELHEPARQALARVTLGLDQFRAAPSQGQRAPPTSASSPLLAGCPFNFVPRSTSFDG